MDVREALEANNVNAVLTTLAGGKVDPAKFGELIGAASEFADVRASMSSVLDVFPSRGNSAAGNVGVSDVDEAGHVGLALRTAAENLAAVATEVVDRLTEVFGEDTSESCADFVDNIIVGVVAYHSNDG